ncbi:unnamed protein product [Haemonchus placei]|uniref:DUF4440 domain-containing protein n=1 Tax=Haemonchus placei TaxID=6290 RepID=A0A0N4X7G1_HAEPC|nr:unnamed protein product [Haemonchus placei]
MLDQRPNPKNDDEMRRAREEEAKIIKRNGEFMEKVEEVDDEEVNIIRRNDEIGNNVELRNEVNEGSRDYKIAEFDFEIFREKGGSKFFKGKMVHIWKREDGEWRTYHEEYELYN